MRREGKIAQAVDELCNALEVCCAACHAIAGKHCTDTEGRERLPHKVRIKIGRWYAR